MIKIKPVSHIIGNIYIGSIEGADDVYGLRKRDIRYVINCASERNDAEIIRSGKFYYLKINMTDNPTEQISQFYTKAHRYIKRAEDSKKNIFIHCNVGASRSVVIVLSYLMKFKNMSLKSAFELVKEKRKEAKPNIGYFRQLISFEERLYREKHMKDEDEEEKEVFKPSITRETYKNKYYYIRKHDSENSNRKILDEIFKPPFP